MSRFAPNILGHATEIVQSFTSPSFEAAGTTKAGSPQEADATIVEKRTRWEMAEHAK